MNPSDANLRFSNGDRLLTIAEVAALTQVDESTVYRWRMELRPELRLKSIPLGRSPRVWESDLLDFLRRRDSAEQGVLGAQTDLE